MTQIKSIVGLIGLNCGTIGSALTGNGRKVGKAKMRDFILKTFTDDEAETCQRCNMQEVIRCKDCKDACIYSDDWVICTHVDSNGNDKHPVDWFCADGERR